MNILLSCAGRRHYLAEYFRTENRARVIGSDMSPTAPALYACDSWHLAPAVESPCYLDDLKASIIREGIHMVFSLNDLESKTLVENRTHIERETGATVYVPAPDTLSVCADKWHSYLFACEVGVNAPATFLSSDAALRSIELGQVDFPLIVKPRWGSASIGLFYVNGADELPSAFSSCCAAVANSSLAAFGEDQTVVIQEVVSGPEYGVDILYNKDERLVGFAAKKKLAMRAGETDKAITVPPRLFEPVIERMAPALRHRGNLDCDFLERDGELYLLEMNPRFSGGYPFTHLAGANHVRMLLDDFEGRELTPYRYAVGRAFAKCDRLVDVSGV